MSRASKIIIKSISVALICIFMLNKVSWALQVNPLTQKLQVETPFKPMTDVIGLEYENQIKTEAALIMAMIKRGEDIYKINMELEKTSSIYNELKRGKKIRLFEVIDPLISDNKKTVVDLQVRQGKAKGKIFRITAYNNKISQIQEKGFKNSSKNFFDVKNIEKEARIDFQEKSKVKAPQQLYYLKKECLEERKIILEREASSVDIDPLTGEKKFLKEGRKLEAIEGEVFFLEGKKWQIPEGVNLPGNLARSINTEHGALVIMTGPFYEEKYKKVILPIERDPTIRKLSDQEIYERFSLKRVYDYRGKIFTLPVLSMGGKSIIVPKEYSIDLVKRDKGQKLLKKKDETVDEQILTKPVFGLEFKNVGVTAYTGHNKSPKKYPDFPPTIFKSYLGLPGVFLDWQYNLQMFSPVGLHYGQETSIPREKKLLMKDSELTRWTLAENELGGNFRITLRVPVGDYRRLSIFFTKYGEPKKELFYKIIKEKGVEPEEYLLNLARTYGKNFRNIIEEGIIQPGHGAIINSDIDGKLTDIEDYLSIKGMAQEELKQYTEDWTMNFFKIVGLVDLNEKLYEEILTVFAASFFRVSKEQILLKEDKDQRALREDVRNQITDFVVEKEKAEEIKFEQIGKKAFVKKMEKTEEGKRVERKVIDKKGKKHKLIIKETNEIGVKKIKEQIHKRGEIKKSTLKIIDKIMSLAEKQNIRVYTFETIIEDLLGFSITGEKMVAIHNSLKNEYIALFHEVMGYLFKEGQIDLKLKGSYIYLTEPEGSYGFDATKAIEELQQEKEEWAFWQDKEINRSMHYLLRIFQRTLFRKEDKELTEKIQKILIAEKVRKYEKGFGTTYDNFYDLLSFIKDCLKGENQRISLVASEIMLTLERKGLVSKEELRKRLPIKMICNKISSEMGTGQSMNILKEAISTGAFTAKEIRENINLKNILITLNEGIASVKPGIARLLKSLIETGVFKKTDIMGNIKLEPLAENINSKDAEQQRGAAEALSLLIESGIVEKQQIDKVVTFEHFNNILKRKNTPVRDYFYTLKTVIFLLKAGFFKSSLKDGKNMEKYFSVIKETLKCDSSLLRAEAIKSIASFLEEDLLTINEIEKEGILDLIAETVGSDEMALNISRKSYKEISEIIIRAEERGETIRKRLPVLKLTQTIASEQLTGAVESAKALGLYVKKGIIDKNKARRILPLNLLYDELNDDTFLDRTNDSCYERALVLQSLTEAGLVDPGEVAKGILPSSHSLFSKGIRYWSYDREKVLKAIKVLLQTDLLMNIEQGGFIHKTAEEMFPDKEKPFPREADPIYLKALTVCEEKDKNKIDKYFTPEIIELFELGGTFLIEQFVRESRKEPAINEMYTTLKKILVERLLSFQDRTRDPLKLKDLFFITRKTGKVIARSFARGEKVTEEIKKACNTLFVELNESGKVTDTTSFLYEALIGELPALEFKELPEKKPEYTEKRPEEIPIVVEDVSYSSENSKKIGKGSDLRLVKVLGRTVVYKTPENKFLAFKFLKEGEDPGKLLYENRILGYLNKLARKGVDLKGKYPVPVFFHNEGKKERVIRLPRDFVPGRSNIEQDIIAQIEKSTILDHSLNSYTLMAYEADDMGYFTYIDTVKEEAKARHSLEVNIHDLLILAQYGLIHPDLISIFHSGLSDLRPDSGKYVWMIDVVRPLGERLGAGRLEEWERALDYTNMRVSGPADFAELVSIKELISLENEHSQFMLNNLIRFDPEERELVLLSYYIGNYTLIALLNEVKRKKNLESLNNINAIENIAKKIYKTAYSSFLGEDDGEDITALIDWTRLAHQIIFFMTDEYKSFGNKKTPSDLYGPKRVAIIPGEGWGYIHEDKIKSELRKRGIDRTRDKKILSYYFNKAAPTNGRTAVPKMYVFKEDCNELLLFEESEEIRKAVTFLYEKYNSGWRANGKDDDLGPVNGPNPLTELIKANYIFTMAMMARARRKDKEERKIEKKEKKKTEREIINVEYPKKYIPGENIKLEVYNKNTIELEELLLEIKGERGLDSNGKEKLIDSVEDKDRAFLEKIIDHFPRFLKIHSIGGNTLDLIDIIYVPKKDKREKLEFIAGREELVDNPYYLFYLFSRALVESAEKKGYFTIPFHIELRKNLLFINTFGEIVKLDVSFAKKSLLDEGCTWVTLPDSSLNLKRNNKYLIRILCRQLFKGKDIELWKMRRFLYKEGVPDKEIVRGQSLISSFVGIADIKKELEADIKITPAISEKVEEFYRKYLETQRAFLDQKPPASLEYLNKCFNAKRIADMFYLYEVYGFNVLELMGIKRKSVWKKEGTQYEVSVGLNNQINMIQKTGEGKEIFVGSADNNDYARNDFSEDPGKDLYHNLNIGNFFMKVHNYLLWAHDNRKVFSTEIRSSGGEKLIKYYETIGFETRKINKFGRVAIRQLFGGIDAGILSKENAIKMKGLSPYVWKVWSQRFLDRYLNHIKDINEDTLKKAYPTINSYLDTLSLSEKRQYPPEKIAEIVKNIIQGEQQCIGKKTTLLYLNRRGKDKVAFVVKKSTGDFETIFGKRIEKREIMETLKKIRTKDDGHKALLLKMVKLLETSPPDFYSYSLLPEDLFGKAVPANKAILLHESIKENPVAILHELLEYFTNKNNKEIRVEFKGALPKILYHTGLYSLLKRFWNITEKLKGQIRIIDFGENKEFSRIDITGESLAIALKDLGNEHYLLRAIQREIAHEQDKVLSGRITVEQNKALLEEALLKTKISQKARGDAERLIKSLIAAKRYRKDNKDKILSFLACLSRNKGEKEAEAFVLAKEFIDQGLVEQEDLYSLAEMITELITFSEVLPKDRLFVVDGSSKLIKEGHIVLRNIIKDIKEERVDKKIFNVKVLAPAAKKAGRYRGAYILRVLNIIAKYNRTQKKQKYQELVTFINRLAVKIGSAADKDATVHSFERIEQLVSDGIASKKILSVEFLTDLTELPGTSVQEVLLVVKEIAEEGMAREESFHLFREFLEEVLPSQDGRTSEQEKIKFLVRTSQEKLLPEAGFENIRMFMDQIRDKKQSRVFETGLFELLNTMVESDILRQDNLWKMTELFDLLIRNDIVEQEKLFSDLKALVRAVKEQKAPREIAGPEFLKTLLEDKEQAAYRISQINRIVREEKLEKTDVVFLQEWIRKCLPVEKGVMENFLGLPLEEKREYLKNRENIINGILNGKNRKGDKKALIAGYEILAAGFEEKNKNLFLLPEFDLYRNIVERKKDRYDVFTDKEKAEIRYAAYESVKLRAFLLKLKKKADEQRRPLVIVENLQFGKIPVLEIEEELKKIGVKIIEVGARSTYAHGHPEGLHGKDGKDDAELFKEEDLKYILIEKPLIAVIDGSTSIDREIKKKSVLGLPHFADAFQIFRNYFHAISSDPDDDMFGLEGLTDRLGNLLSKSIREYSAYKDLREKAQKISKKRPNYKLFFWYYGKSDIAINNRRIPGRVPEKMQIYNLYDPDKPYLDKITEESVVFINANMHDRMIPDVIRPERIDAKGEEDPSYHNSGYFDYNNCCRIMSVSITEDGPVCINAFESLYREEYERLKDYLTFDVTASSYKDKIITEKLLFRQVKQELEHDLTIEKGMEKELRIFIGRYYDILQSFHDNDETSNMEYLKESSDKKRIAELFYLYKKYQFDIFRLIYEGETSWKNKEKGMEYTLNYFRSKGHSIIIKDTGSEKKERISPASAREGFYRHIDFEKNKGRNIGNFIIKTHHLIEWMVGKQRKIEESLSNAIDTEKLADFYISMGGHIYPLKEDHIRVAFSLKGGIKAGILSSEESEKIRELDPRIWRMWSQRDLDIFFSLIKEEKIERVLQASREFSRINKEKDIGYLRKIEPRKVGKYIVNYRSFERTKRTQEIIKEERPKAGNGPLEKTGRRTEKQIKKVNQKSIGVFYLLARIREKYGIQGTKNPIDIVIDLTLIPEEDEESNLETWAQLILISRNMKNVNFILEKPQISARERLDKRLRDEWDHASKEENATARLKEKIRKKIKQLNLETEINADEFCLNRISSGRREGAVEVPIISKVWLKWQEQRSWEDPGTTLLEGNQFPVAMEDLSYIKDEGLLLRNFEAALAIGLIKAHLVLLKKRDKQLEQKDLTDIMARLQSMYDIFKEVKPEFAKVTVDEYFLENMISEHETVRLEHAIKMALPAITRLFIEELRKYHEIIQTVLQAA